MHTNMSGARRRSARSPGSITLEKCEGSISPDGEFGLTLGMGSEDQWRIQTGMVGKGTTDRHLRRPGQRDRQVRGAVRDLICGPRTDRQEWRFWLTGAAQRARAPGSGRNRFRGIFELDFDLWQRAGARAATLSTSAARRHDHDPLGRRRRLGCRTALGRTGQHQRVAEDAEDGDELIDHVILTIPSAETPAKDWLGWATILHTKTDNSWLVPVFGGLWRVNSGARCFSRSPSGFDIPQYVHGTHHRGC